MKRLLSCLAALISCLLLPFNGPIYNPTPTQALRPQKAEAVTPAFTAGWAKQVSTGTDHTCALTIKGGVQCWGSNDHGQLGNGTRDGSLIPVDVVGLQQGVRAIAAGDYHTCAVTNEGVAKCWGNNDQGQLGDGTRIDATIPIAVTFLEGNVRSITASEEFSCALTDEGDAKCWGDNTFGNLGDGSTTDRLEPVDVVGLPKPIQGISQSAGGACAFGLSGSVYCWGDNTDGKLGDGTTERRLIPVAATVLTETVRAVSTGSMLTCVITKADAVRCWGANMGDGVWSRSLTPVTPIGLQENVADISTTTYYACALLKDGQVRCWGDNAAGQLGDGTKTRRPSPVAVSGLADAASVSAGYHHTCAVTTSGNVKCWGWNDAGQLGDGTKTDRLTPVDVLHLPAYDCAQVTQITPQACRGLVTLFEQTRGLLWRHRKGWLENPLACSWYGVTCTASPLATSADPPPPGAYTVTALNLADNKLYGALPPELANLDGLVTLDLSSNDLSGPLPPALGPLNALQSLNLSETDVAGPVPDEWGALSALRELRLDHTHVSQLSKELGNLQALEILDLNHAQLRDTALPSELGQLTALRYLDLSVNQVSGPLPPTLGNLTQLETLALNNNALTGPLPESWGQLATLQRLDLNQNALTGALPAAWGSLTALDHLSLVGNQLEGPLPPSFENLARLTFLDLGYNQFNGGLPPEWGNLRNVEVLGLGHNHLSGPLPASWAGLAGVYFLELNDNALSGPLPPAWGGMGVLVLDLGRNQLNGPIPPEWGGLYEVQGLYLDDNQFSGTIPKELGNIASGLSRTAVQTPARRALPDANYRPPHDPEVFLSLCSNHLSGKIPAELLKINYLSTLLLTGNQLDDSPPDYSGTMTESTSKLYNKLNVADGTQTIPPTDLAVHASETAITLTWAPILYVLDGGFYEIETAPQPGGPYTVQGRTADKTASSYTRTDLAPKATYYFRVHTFTPAHALNLDWGQCQDQPNDLWSDYTPVVCVNCKNAYAGARTFLPILLR